jgi:hypothetical protein
MCAVSVRVGCASVTVTVICAESRLSHHDILAQLEISGPTRRGHNVLAFCSKLRLECRVPAAARAPAD